MLDEKKEDAIRAASDFEKKHTPLPGNICYCGGLVVRKADTLDLVRGKFYYGLPQCIKCNRMYLNAHDAPTCGEEEFIEIIFQPMTI
jgi:hypothetical protein